jgi:hypothetical protein
MAEVGVTVQQVPPADKNIGTVQAHGLETPENTPPPEDARIEAEKARRQAAQNADAQQKKASAESLPNSKDEFKGDGAKSEEGKGRSKEQTNDGGKSVATSDAATISNEPQRNGDEIKTETTTSRPERT